MAKTAPVASTTATLHPVRYPGSIPMTVAVLGAGGCRSNCRKFLAKTPMACSSAASVNDDRISRSTAGPRSLRYPSSIARKSSGMSSLATGSA